ncbi:KOW motif-containing protein [Planktomarina sp.]|nr:KOW motif-containing protein [Planktomarina sp.]
MNVKSWFLLQYKPNSHRVALRNLHRQGFETFLPIQDITQQKPTKFVQQPKPLFAGYMFISFERESAPWRQINSTIGVSRLVSIDGQPRELPLDLVSGLMLRCDSSGKILPPALLSAGDEVQVLSGPFASFIATVENIDAKHRIWVLIDFMGRGARMQIQPEQLKLSY